MSEEMTEEEAQELDIENFKAMQRDKHYAEKRATALEAENKRLREALRKKMVWVKAGWGQQCNYSWASGQPEKHNPDKKGKPCLAAVPEEGS